MIYAFIAAMLYGTSYQQFRYYDVNNNYHGANDGRSFIAIANQDTQNILPQHKYRAVVPFMAKYIESNFLKNIDIKVKLSFYIINFFFMSLAAFFMFLILRQIGFDTLSSLLGIAIFLSSRIVILSTGTPLIDSTYFFAVSLIVYLLVSQQYLVLMLVSPVVIIFKELVILYLILALYTNDLYKNKFYWVSIGASLASYVMYRSYIDSIIVHQGVSHVESFINTLFLHLGFFFDTLKTIFTLKGAHDLFNGFSFLYGFALLGLYMNYKYHYYRFPKIINYAFGIAVFITLISSNLGRKFFTSYISVIPYILVFIEHIKRNVEKSTLKV
jgi:hypothetical protein